MMHADLIAEVLVVGGGLAGVAAAVAAARDGARTVLVEGSHSLGGTATAGVNCSFMGMDVDLMGGLNEEIVSLLRAREGIIYGVHSPFSVESLKQVCFELCDHPNLSLVLGAAADDVMLTDGAVSGVTFRTKRGVDLVTARTVVDATGDGDVAAASGAEFELGDPATGDIQPVSLLFRMGNVDDRALVDYVRRNPDQFYTEDMLFICDDTTDPPLLIANGFFDWVRQQRSHGLSIGRDALGIIKTPNPGEVLVNSTRSSHVNALNVHELTRAAIDLRQQMATLVRCLQEGMPGFGDSYLIDSGGTLGVRETRRFRGVYQLTADDVQHSRVFDDCIARNFFPIDIHGPSSNPGGYTWIPPEGQGWYTIPFRCLVPERVDGLLLAGRCISVSHTAFGSTRSMPCCIATGQAAGVAASLSARHRSRARDVDVEQLQAHLTQQRVRLGSDIHSHASPTTG